MLGVGPFATVAEDADRVSGLALDPGQRARVALIAGQARLYAGEVDGAQSHFATAAALSKDLGDRELTVRILGSVASSDGLVANRAFHFRTDRSDWPVRRATSCVDTPSAHRTSMQARTNSLCGVEVERVTGQGGDRTCPP